MTAIGTYRQLVTLEKEGKPVPDGDGGFTQPPIPLIPPTWYCAIQPATARDLERAAGGTVLAQATHIVRGRFRPDVTTEARVIFEGRTLNVVHVTNRDERKIELELLCAEVVT